MIRLICILFLGFFISSFAQEPIVVIQKDSITLHADKFLYKDNFDAIYFVKNNTLNKQTAKEYYQYNTILLGSIDYVDVLNPLEITLFYKNFNTVVQLDNRLSEINKIDFNTLPSFKNINWAATASNKRLWVYNNDNLQLEVYNFQLDKTDSSTLPLSEKIISYTSNYNFCWLLTQKGILQYNIYGNLLNSISFEGAEEFSQSKNNFIFLKENKLYFLKNGAQKAQKIDLPKMAIKDFSLSQESLYIYNGETLFTYQLNLEN